MCGAVIEQGPNGFNTNFGITVLSLGDGGFRRKTFGEESIIAVFVTVSRAGACL